MSIETADMIVKFAAGAISGSAFAFVFFALVDRWGWLFGSAIGLVAVFAFADAKPYVAELLRAGVRFVFDLGGVAQ